MARELSKNCTVSFRYSAFVNRLSFLFSRALFPKDGYLRRECFVPFQLSIEKVVERLLVRSTFTTRSQEYTYPTNKEGRKIVKLILIPY